MMVLCQWSDDLQYTRRNAEYAAVNCSSIDSSCKMDVGGSGPNSGGSKSVHFTEDNASDSV